MKNLNLSKHTNASQHAQSLGMYLGEISKKSMNPLTHANEMALFLEYQEIKDTNTVRAKEIRDMIILSNLRFVITIAKQYEYPKAKREDLVSEGNLGLFKAFDKFDAEKGNRFLTFANHYIHQSIRDFLNQTLPDIVQPTNRLRVDRLMNKVEAQLRRKGFLEPTDEQMVEMYLLIKDKTDLHLTVADYQEMKRNRKDFSSMSQVLGSAGDGEFTLGDTFRTNEENEPDYEIKKQENKDALNRLMQRSLSSLEFSIVELHLGLNNKESKTLDQLTEIIKRPDGGDYTRARIGQIFQTAKDKLKLGKLKELCRVNNDDVQMNFSFA
jgi:RNA polymerase primary sigma factor